MKTISNFLVALSLVIFSTTTYADNFECTMYTYKKEKASEQTYTGKANFITSNDAFIVKLQGDLYSFPPLEQVNETLKVTKSGDTFIGMSLGNQLRFKILDLKSGDITTFFNCDIK